MNIIESDKNYIANTYARFPLVLKSGKGALLYDDTGKEYIDLGAGIAVNIFGAADEEWLAAVTAQASALQHTSNLYYTEPCVKLAEMLCERTGMKKVFFGNSGAEANEAAIKAARRWSFVNKGEGSSTIITLKNSFHGRTITTLSATGQENYHTDFMPFTPGFVYADANDAEDVRRLAEENRCCAVMLEMIQGEGGVNCLSEEFVHAVEEIAREKDLLIIIDEVQTGNGRTGKLYAYMHYGIKPDIVTTAKGLAGGLPIGCAMLGERVQDILPPGTHGSTFGGNPVSCAAAVSVLSRVTEDLLAQVNAKSKLIREALSAANGVKSVNGMGLMLGIECERPAKEVLADCMANGVLVLTAKNKIRLLPPLNISQESLEKALKILLAALAA